MPDFRFRHDGRLVAVVLVYPPIPIRTMDWQATFEDDEDSGPVGHGPTAVDAVSSLLGDL